MDAVSPEFLLTFARCFTQENSESLIIAATNHGGSLDSALFRRFDDVIHYSQPDPKQIEMLLKNSLASLAPSNLGFTELVKAADGLSHAEIVSACQDAMKDAVLDHNACVSQTSVLQHLNERSANLSLLKNREI